ncbi:MULTISPECIES: beta-N-acetylhexosaminidase [Thalassolituus]|jgi:beta-N-acetylhexosaminidase|uniref:beta-N-acetylhexosaminidase n=1 Tax=Thalassolituus TaxID=187492 RepID=UPI0023F04965|nr:beta-N-acetylhexosaminidase [Thalassolituus oleivorans]
MSQPLIIQNNAIGVVADIAGFELTANDKTFLMQPEICGLILFSRNYQSPQQLQRLTQALHEIRPDLLISVDQEGGRVQRFREGFTRLPAMLSFENDYLKNPDQTLQDVRDLGWLMAVELLQHGVDLSYAPVLDIERDCSRVIGDRAFGHNAESVMALSQAWVSGMQDAGMCAVGKHFPGHGAVIGDSHHELPIDNRSSAEINGDIAPFKHLMDRQQLVGIMPAHVRYPAVDADNTAGFSAKWLQGCLRTELQFTGVIFSDDLSMAGAASGGDYFQRASLAARAGCNALLACNNREGAEHIVAAVRELQSNGYQSLSLAQLIPASYVIDPERYQAVKTRLLLAGRIA